MPVSPPKHSASDETTQIELHTAHGGKADDRAYVMVRADAGARVFVVEPGEPIVLGRGDEADILVDDTRASRRHAEITLRDGRLWVRDLGSRNGTKVAGAVLKNEELAVSRGDEIVIGPTRITVVALPAVSAAADESIVVEDGRMKELIALAERLAAVPTPVLIHGETGAGKELFAELLHQRGPRSKGPLIRLNCAAVPESLLESELFGHERGAFTGATEKKRGFLELADHGTLFLDEVGDLPLAMQAKLLRALETQRVQRVGGREELSVDVRFVCATHRDLGAMVEAGTFRKDLYYRIAGFVIEVPPLRERRAEIGPLAARFVQRFAAKLGQAAPPIAADALSCLEAHSWPGNVRELKNAVEHAVVLAGAAPVGKGHLPRSVVEGAQSAGSSMRDQVDVAERAAIERALSAAGGHRARAAEILGISKRTLQYRLAKLGVKE